MISDNTYSQLFTEYEDKNLHIDIHLEKFDELNARVILDYYIKRYSDKEIKYLFIKFWDKKISGDYLSLWRKKSSDSFLTEPLNGFRYIGAVHNYPDQYSEVKKASLVTE